MDISSTKIKKIDPSVVPPFTTEYFPYPEEQSTVSKYWKDKFETDAGKNWDIFYKTHTTNFFKDRHWICREFPELQEQEHQKLKILEIGCGVGNTTLPVMKALPNAEFFSFDFARTAIKLLKSNPLYEPGRCNAFVLDVVSQEIPVGKNEINFVFIIFVLSAISPEHYPCIMQKIYEVLAPGGIILFRDYGKGDMAETRFEHSTKTKKIDDNFYVRKDGTRAYYFTTEELKEVFPENKFKTLQNEYIQKEVKNNKQGLKMDRRWIQAKFQKTI